jgi:hypothetical protein
MGEGVQHDCGEIFWFGPHYFHYVLHLYRAVVREHVTRANTFEQSQDAQCIRRGPRQYGK